MLDENTELSKLALKKLIDLEQAYIEKTKITTPVDLRVLLDEIRTSRSLFIEHSRSLKIYLESKDVDPNFVAEVTALFEIHKIADKFISEQLAASIHESKLSRTHLHFEDVDLLMDVIFPSTWNYSNDVVILAKIHQKIFEEPLKRRGQKRIIIHKENFEIIDDTTIHASLENLHMVFDHFGFICPRTVCSISHALPSELKSDYFEFCDSFGEILKARYTGLSTQKRFGTLWAKNTIENIPYVLKGRSAWDLSNFFKDSDVIIVSAGPSLEQNIKFLRNTKDNIVVAVAQALPALTEFGITPDFVVVIDPLGFDESHFRETISGANLEELSLICSEYISVDFTKLPFKDVYFALSEKDGFPLAEVFESKAFEYSGASSVSVFAASLAFQLGAKRIALTGQDLSFEDTQYAGSNMENEESFASNKKPIELPGYYGGTVKSKYDYAFYHSQFVELSEQTIKSKPTLELYNCTEGGAFIKGFMNISLNNFLDLGGKKIKSRVNSQKLKNTFSRQKGLKFLYKINNDFQIQIKLLEKWFNRENLNLTTKDVKDLELKIFNRSLEVKSLGFSLHAPLVEFAEACFLGFDNEIVQIKKFQSLRAMYEICTELEQVQNFIIKHKIHIKK
ncbi:DUF115 domain-containing protein [Paracoccaceae bacterium]|nr:DUF115 domain-containing protein [Paracoccaceae bacterium]